MQVPPTSPPGQPLPPEQPAPQDLKLGAEFLLIDFQQLSAFIDRAEAFVSRSADILVALVSGLAAAIAFLPQTVYAAQILVIMMFAIVAVLIMGLIAFRQAVRRDIQVTNYARAMNRIRAYFAEQVPAIQQYVIMPVLPTYPAYGHRSRGREVIMVLNCLLVSSFVLALTAQVRALTIPYLNGVQVITLEFILTFVAVFLVQILYAKAHFKRAERRSRQILARSEGYYGIYPKLSG